MDKLEIKDILKLLDDRIYATINRILDLNKDAQSIYVKNGDKDQIRAIATYLVRSIIMDMFREGDSRLFQVKITVDIFLGMLVQYIRDISNDIHALQKNNATHAELMEKQMELAELVYYYETTGVLTALRVHWPATDQHAVDINELFDRALKLRQDKDVIEELDYLRKVR